MEPSNFNNQKQPLILQCILFVKNTCLPNALPVATTVLVALSIFSFAVPNVASPIIFTATIVVGVAYGASFVLFYITPHLPTPLKNFAEFITPFFKELVSMGLLATIYFMDLSKKNSEKVPNGNDPLIFIVCGYMHNSSGALYLQHEIESRTGIPVRCINPPSLFSSIHNHSDHLSSEMLKADHKTNNILIGHSMGGLIALDYAFNKQAPNAKVSDVITIATPSKGTTISKVGLGECSKEMCPNSEFIQDTNAKSMEHKVRVMQIGLKHDIIVPSRAAFLDGVTEENRHILEDVGHTEILLKKETADLIINYIQSKYPRSQI